MNKQNQSNSDRFCVQPCKVEYQGQEHTVYMIRDLTIYFHEEQANAACAALNLTPPHEVADAAARWKYLDSAPVEDEFTNGWGEIHWPTYCDLVTLANWAASRIGGGE